MVFCLPVIGRVSLGLASGHFSGQTAGRDSSARFGVKPTGNRDAGKCAGRYHPIADGLPTQKPSETSSSPLAQAPTRLSPPQRKSPAPGAGGGLEFRGSNSTKRISVVRPFYSAFLVGRLTLISASMLRHIASRRLVREARTTILRRRTGCRPALTRSKPQLDGHLQYNG